MSYKLHFAARNGLIDMMRDIIASTNVNVNEQNRFGCTPLNLAAEGGHIEIVEELFKHEDIDVNLQGE